MPKLGWKQSEESKNKIRESCKKSYNPTKFKKGEYPSPKTEFIKGQPSLKKKIFYPIPSLCECEDPDCHEITWNGKKYAKGHWSKKNRKFFSKPRSEITLKRMSDAQKGKISPMKGVKGKNHPLYGIVPKTSYGKRHYYHSPCQGEICLKCSYELAYAKYLDSIGEPWYYEIKAFQISIDNKDTTYTPDFYLPNYNKFIEIKGYMRKISQNKIDTFKKEYSYLVEILFKKDMLSLGIYVK